MPVPNQQAYPTPRLPTGMSLTVGTGYIGVVATTTNDDLVLVPNGTGALQAAVTDSTAAGGDARGNNAVDWQTVRANANQVASGNRAVVSGGDTNRANGALAVVAGGSGNLASASYVAVGGGLTNTASNTAATVSGGASNTASQTYATVGGGQSNTASAAWTAVGGGQSNQASLAHSTVAGGYANIANGGQTAVGGGALNTASGTNSFVGGGAQALANHYGEQAHASGQFSAQGDAQRGDVGMRCAVTDATPGVLTLDGAADGASNRFTIAIGAVYQFTVECTAVQTGGTSGTAGDSRHFFIKGAISNKGGTTALISSTAETVYGAAAAAAWTLVVTGGNTNDCLILTFTGEADKSVRINATVRYTKTSFA